MEISQLIHLNYCTQYEYLSNNALEFHFRIRFAVQAQYLVNESPTFWGALFGSGAKEKLLKEERLHVEYLRKKVRWYRADTLQQASVEEETRLNQVYAQIMGMLVKVGKLPSPKAQMRPGYQETFPLRKVSVLLQN